MPASVELLGGPVWEPQRLVLVENVLAWDVATHEVAVAAEWAESGVEKLAVMDGIKSSEQVPLVESGAMAVAEW